MAKVEQLGAEGNVEESQKVMDEVEKARAKKREAEVIQFLMVICLVLLSKHTWLEIIENLLLVQEI